MTTELTKAAQQALEAYDAFADADDFSTLFELTRKMNVLRDLTQRPAAQTEREAFEAWARPNGYDLRRNDVLGHYSSIDTSRAWDGFRAGRASLPAPQQATSHVETDWISNVIRDVSELPDRSSPDDEPDMMLVTAAELRSILETHAPQQATPERHLTVTTNQQGEAVMVSWQDDEHRILDVVWERKPATPEPVGWTDADADAARLAMELECLLLDTKDTAAVSRWWKSADEALDLHRARLAAAQAKGADQ